MFRGGQKLIQN